MHMNNNTPIVCVLSQPTNGDQHASGYGPEHVRWLRDQCAVFAPTTPFVCLSYTGVQSVDTIVSKRFWRGWWAKLELFEQFTDALYLDLDTVLVGPIEDLVQYKPKGLLALRKLSGLLDGDPDSIGSGVMRWCGDYSHITRAFADDPKRYMSEYTHKFKWGDQGFILDHINEFEYLQTRFPRWVVSYKRHDGLDMGRNELPDETRIVCFHGRPRPWEVKEDYVPCLSE